MTDTELPFIAAICTNVGDDNPRLQYADWLEGDARPVQPERAEFIRVQVELARWTDPKRCSTCGKERRFGWCSGGVEWTDCPNNHEWRPGDHDELRRREGELLRQGYFDWSPFDHEFHKQHHQPISYRRGFVAELRIPWAVWAGGLCPRCLVAGAGCNYCGHTGRVSGVAESLYWRLQPCPECKGTRGYAEPRGLANGGERGIDCSRCAGSGRVVPTVECPLTYEERRPYACKVCGNIPDEDGMIEHGRGCYTQGPDGGGRSLVELPTGRAPRPCPAGARPVTAVAFTSRPVSGEDYFYTPEWGEGRRARLRGRQWHPSPTGDAGVDEWVAALLAAEWPGIKFTLPAADPRETVDLGRRGVS